ncbi:MAG TPA: hypothetical protein VKM36_00870 [Balneolaceae bacterium]|nr:hypothetical protein [Balneolaceae bacterium]
MYFFSKSSGEERVAHQSSQAEGLAQLSPDTAVSGFQARGLNGQAEGLQQVRFNSDESMMTGHASVSR